jgi:hypothetical protein
VHRAMNSSSSSAPSGCSSWSTATPPALQQRHKARTQSTKRNTKRNGTTFYRLDQNQTEANQTQSSLRTPTD